MDTLPQIEIPFDAESQNGDYAAERNDDVDEDTAVGFPSDVQPSSSHGAVGHDATLGGDDDRTDDDQPRVAAIKHDGCDWTGVYDLTKEQDLSLGTPLPTLPVHQSLSQVVVVPYQWPPSVGVSDRLFNHNGWTHVSLHRTRLCSVAFPTFDMRTGQSIAAPSHDITCVGCSTHGSCGGRGTHDPHCAAMRCFEQLNYDDPGVQLKLLRHLARCGVSVPEVLLCDHRSLIRAIYYRFMSVDVTGWMSLMLVVECNQVARC